MYSGGRGRSMGRPQPQTLGQRPTGYIGYGRLQEWVRVIDRPSELLVWMMSNVPELNTFLNGSVIRPDWMRLFLICLEAVLQVQTGSEKKRRVDTIVKYIQETARIIPSVVMSCHDVLIFIINNYKNLDCDVQLLNNTVKCFNSAENVKLKKEKSRLRKWRDSDDPPDDIRDLSIFPTMKDMEKDFQPFLRANKVRSAYRDKEHYFDVMFRLMREDFIQPLREGINRYRLQGSADLGDDMIFYENVQIVGVEIFNGIEHILLLDMNRLKTIRWNSDQRLIFGSLVCLSKDNFKTIIYATVSQMDRDELKRGVLRVRFQNCLEDVYQFSTEDSLTMTENPSFFEAYRHVLEGLQEMMETSLPMENYLVHCDNQIELPSYVNNSTTYDLSCIVRDSGLRQSLLRQQNMYRVLQETTWSTMDRLCLNTQQRKAVQNALTKELSLLQGPPGTGKTYVGLKIMQILFANCHVVVRGVRNDKFGPILVVCYTNHALDQFLEEMLKFCPRGIVRVGGKMDCVALKKFNLSELRRESRDSLSMRNCIRDCHRVMDAIGAEIMDLVFKMQKSQLVIQEENVLRHFMTAAHQTQMLGMSTTKGLSTWLNASSIDLEQQIKNAAEAHLVKLFLVEVNPLPDTNLNFRSKISTLTKRKVYHYWCTKYKQTFGPPPQLKMLSEDVLKYLISSQVLDSLNRMNLSIRQWLLGTSTKDFLDAIEEIQTEKVKTDLKMFDDADEYARIRDQRVFGDEQDDDHETSATESRHRKREMTILQRAKVLGVDVTVDAAEDGTDPAKEWQKVQKKLSFGQVVKKLKATKPMSEREEKQVNNVWLLDINDRYRLYKLWIDRYLKSLNGKIKSLVEEYDEVLARKMEVRKMQDVDILEQAQVIGMTTTGAAKHRKLLQAVKPRIVVVEEAAEVLEAHIVTALSEHCQHLILIGDHKQLRPKTEVYQLAKQFGLEISLFERLVNNDVSCVQLTEQHRMRPEISKYMLHIYPKLINSASVNNRENVKGMVKNIFFIKHNRSEGTVKHSKSKLNEYEANYLLRLAEYLIYQGYTPEEITILATYGGQVSLIKETMVNNFPGNSLQNIRVSTVDNFQGEQNKIILLSLVRSNTQESVGFLSTDNRVCVALSRAQYGMYVIGNIDLLARHSELWAKVKRTAEGCGETGEILQLRCHRHRRMTEIKDVKDFSTAKTGGCGEACGANLLCGHVCPYLCHVLSHTKVPCTQPCLKKCSRNHPCRYKCDQTCPKCVVVFEHQLSCGHVASIPCHDEATFSIDKHTCMEPCRLKCQRGHPCLARCREKCPPCPETLQCGHKCDVTPRRFSTGLAPSCTQPCRKVCKRGHKCPAKCHEICPSVCQNKLPCGHECDLEFKTENIGKVAKVVCSKPCLKKCRNNHRCPGSCSDVCPPCTKLVEYHYPCNHILKLPCNENEVSEIGRCQKVCERTCARGHKCGQSHHLSCPPCQQRMKHLGLCEHWIRFQCHQNKLEVECSECKLMDDLVRKYSGLNVTK
ncbi:NFX1-type zinc finger-containing protein 1-like [Physella acuta]|uniref:NFX1-type zinc finger-containing protein 1-like n=1 Tax=Physella acuta TaxID=109671 RepID=UPI0027DD1C46|nr:NFX1-type zinc finger-containing protein 1-like [Physella acuta]